MLRGLTPAESFLTGIRINHIGDIRGDVDEGLLAKAVDAVAATRSALRASRGLLVRDSSLADELAVPLGPEETFRATLLPGTFVLTVEHSIADGRAALALFRAILETYTALAEGMEVPVLPPDHGRSALDGLRHWSEADVAAHIEHRRATAADVPRVPFDHLPEGGLDLRRLLFAPELTGRLATRAKAEGASLHGLIAAALLLAARAEIGPVPGPLGLVSTVDLRSRLVPPMAPDALTHCSSWFIDSVEVAEDSDPFELARGIRRRLRAALDTGYPELEMLALETVVRDPGFSNLVTVNLTNLGRVTSPRLPRGLELTDWSSYMSSAVDRWNPDAPHGVLPAGVFTVDGRLDITIRFQSHCFGPQRIERILDHVRETLTRGATC
ncbi:hypothetical protein Lesp02_12680 [Lentzea sp. NBRC 105346]|uniref:phthiocerol/phthiodiolone dimycocerosyl transferase family protein n=1 Tax=Lentzea sp. NBRC 105346 TaxID=3032205 RepID=UPI0024A2F1D6|nr:hypothetical protein [Lentzea sp. NBRC 105346]GLZ29078.1 hypothetical protein Lesp02_12680 [Lentzea sp. NBRC 105346]